MGSSPSPSMEEKGEENVEEDITKVARVFLE